MGIKIYKHESPSIALGDIMTQISFRAEIDEYTNRVLGVIKEKYGLKTKSDALNKFAYMYGEDFIDKEVKDNIVAEMKQAVQMHKKKYPNRRSNLEELDRLTGVKNV